MNARKGWAADPLREWLRETRTSKQLSLTQAAEVTGVKAVVVGSYERADRTPPINVLRQILAAYGYELAVVPAGTPVPEHLPETLRRLADDSVKTLRGLADEIEQAQVAA